MWISKGTSFGSYQVSGVSGQAIGDWLLAIGGWQLAIGD
jgi:hypothetical protein